jgi:cardiolipin synthase A/B
MKRLEPEEKIFSNGSEYFKALIHDIEHATHEINLETYIFSKDGIGHEIANKLIAAAQRGVKVKILIDGAGAPVWGGKLFHAMQHAGIATKIFHPLPWEMWNWSKSVARLPLLMKLLFLIIKMNSRNHRKTCVIDQRIAYVGSINIDNCHLAIADGGEGWRDSAIRITNTDLQELITAFNCAWSHRNLREVLRDAFRHVRSNPVIRLNNTRHRRRILHKQLLRRMARAQTRIWITNAYFVPDNKLLKRLAKAADYGCDVRILLPNKSDIRLLPWASAIFYQKLLDAGVRIFEYNTNILHAKTLIIDEWMLIGSSNLNHRSLLHDLEVDVQINSPSCKQQLAAQFSKDLGNSHEITLDKWHVRPWYQSLVGSVLLIIRYWL